MGISKIQFQKGLSMTEFMERYGTEAKCHAELVGGGRGSENKVSFIAAVRSTDTDQPLKAGLKKPVLTKEAVADWAKSALSVSAHVVSDGLRCFRAVTGGIACVKQRLLV